MDLIIDANIVISALISIQGKTCDLLFSEKLNLITAELLIREFYEHKKEIIEKSQLSEEELDLALSIISSRIKFIPFLEFKQFIPRAKEICPDPDDIEYFALALKLNCPVWTDDKALKNQNLVKIISTSELLKKFEEENEINDWAVNLQKKSRKGRFEDLKNGI